MEHKLSLEIPNVSDLSSMKIFDTSIYNTLVPFTCPILDVTVPGFNNSIQITTLSKDFNVNLSACDLGVQKNLCGIQFDHLIDGVYVVQWSVSPNDSVYVLYNHLRITNFLIKYNKALCELELSTCAPSKEVHRRYEHLQRIKMYCDAGKVQVEFAHNTKHGLELFLYATKLLNRFLHHEVRGI